MTPDQLQATEPLPFALLQQIDAVCARFEEAWRARAEPPLEEFVLQVAEPQRASLVRELILLDAELRGDRGLAVSAEIYQRRLPAYGELIREMAPLLAGGPRGPGLSATIVPTVSTQVTEQAHLPDALLREYHALGYEILGELGRGGMGVVYKARQVRMNRVVAVKVLTAAHLRTPGAVARFEREAETAARLLHPNIVAAYDAGQVDGVPYLVMEHVEGTNLAALVKERGPLPVGLAVGYLLQAARGLEHAHNRRVIHRDVKPANLLLSTEGVVKVADMGLARLLTPLSDLPPGTLSQSDVIMGSVEYLAPEQAEDCRRADQRSDIYGLGCTLHFLLTGRPPYGGETIMQVLLAHREKPLPSVHPVPPRLQRALRRMIAKRPAERFQSMSDVLTALAPLDGTTVKPVAPRAGRALAVALLLLVAVASLLGIALLPGRRPASEALVAPARPEPPLALAPFSAEQARSCQEQWAAYLNLPVIEKNSLGMSLALIPPGEFLMGSPEETIQQVLNEKYGWGMTWVKEYVPLERPQHQVRITRPFYLGTHEVTVEQFQKFVEATDYKTAAETDGKGGISHGGGGLWRRQGLQFTWRTPGYQSTPNHPVVQVSWDDAQAFCRWLSAREQRTCTLPTEAQWEFACRAGTTTRWFFGDDASLLPGYIASSPDGKYGPRQVGGKKPNPFGLYDVHSNVWEWCADWFAPDAYRPAPDVDPTGPTTGSRRVLRGGSILHQMKAIGSAARYANDRQNPCSDDYGFRVAIIDLAASTGGP